MYSKSNLILLVIAVTIHLFTSCKDKLEDGSIKVDWVDNLEGDYSFSKEWRYSECIFLNSFGQLVCDGMCDPLTDDMRDAECKIYADSLHQYYQLVDTTHHFYSILSEAKCYEWGNTDFVYAHFENDTLVFYTANSVLTHSSLHVSIIKDICTPVIELNSIIADNIQYLKCNGGYIKIDNTYLKKGILKADFDFTFDNTLQASEPMWWKGRIYTKIVDK